MSVTKSIPISNVAVATHIFWDINKCWNGHGSCTVGKALHMLNHAKASIGPQHPVHRKIVLLLDDIVHNQVETTSHSAQHTS